MGFLRNITSFRYHRIHSDTSSNSFGHFPKAPSLPAIDAAPTLQLLTDSTLEWSCEPLAIQGSERIGPAHTECRKEVAEESI